MRDRGRRSGQMSGVEAGWGQRAASLGRMGAARCRLSPLCKSKPGWGRVRAYQPAAAHCRRKGGGGQRVWVGMGQCWDREGGQGRGRVTAEPCGGIAWARGPL